jgi:hypothetical protein
VLFRSGWLYFGFCNWISNLCEEKEEEIQDFTLLKYEPCTRATTRVGLHQGPWSRTMEDGFLPWSDLVVQLPWVQFLKNNQFTKFLGPSLVVNQMWTKRNDHAPKSDCVDFFLNMPKNDSLKKFPSLTILLFSHAFIFFSLKKIQYKFIIIMIFLYHGPLPFSTWAPLLPLPQQNPLDHVSGWCGLSNISLGDLELKGHFDLFSSVETDMILGQVQQLITNLQGLGTTSWSMV